MSITLPQPYDRAHKAKSPFVDSSNRTATRYHAHLRTSSAASLRKSPPTCTLSLDSVTSGMARSVPIDLPLSPPSGCVPFPSDDEEPSACGDESPVLLPEPWRRPRARTSHVETPRRAQPPPKPARRISKQQRASGSSASTSTRGHASSPVDLRLLALVERSIAQCPPPDSTNISEANLELHAQDALLLGRLRAILKANGRRVRSPSPTASGITPPACAPSVLLSGSSGLDGVLPVPFPAAPPAPAASLRFIAPRARSGSRGSTNTGATLGMPALVATLLLRRHEAGRAGSCGAGTFILRRDIKKSLHAPSPLRVLAS
ncbi:hypothetical protein DFH06DRAFT_1241806 [Mycena polygramma]|nr:hypothetical protein DFH06DRAFT_1241806 [Mycena polygramma]